MPDSNPLIVRDQRFREHVAPRGHPERPERLDAVDQAVDALTSRVRELEPRPATDDEILRVHDASHLSLLRQLEGKSVQIDADTYASPRSLEIARLAAGSTVELAQQLVHGDARSGFALVRPPGHHAERGHAMGFCLLNSVAISAQALHQAEGVERIAIVDWDVHHGNGSQHILETSRDILFISLHQFPFYPGTGSLKEQGREAGEGSTLNLPLPAGCGDAEYGHVFEAIVVPVLRQFRPQILLVSAGFDAHSRDPLAAMQLSSRAFGGFTCCLREVAEELCGGRMLLVLEGGYELEALGESVREVLQSLLGQSDSAGFPPPNQRARELVCSFRAAHGPRWSALRSAASG